MKFALGMPALILYPPVMSPWEPDATSADILRIAQTADELGFDWLTISEHIVMPDEMGEVMGRRFPESLSAAAFLAGATKRWHRTRLPSWCRRSRRRQSHRSYASDRHRHRCHDQSIRFHRS